MANTRLVRYIESIGGVATSSELKASGFSASAIAYALETGLVDKLTRGGILHTRRLRGRLHRNRPPLAQVRVLARERSLPERPLGSPASNTTSHRAARV